MLDRTDSYYINKFINDISISVDNIRNDLLGIDIEDSIYTLNQYLSSLESLLIQDEEIICLYLKSKIFNSTLEVVSLITELNMIKTMNRGVI